MRSGLASLTASTSCSPSCANCSISDAHGHDTVRVTTPAAGGIMASGSKAGRRRRTPASASIKRRIKAKATAPSGGALARDARHDGDKQRPRRGARIKSAAGPQAVEPTAARTPATPTSGTRRHAGSAMATAPHHDGATGMLAAILLSSDAAIISETPDGIVTSWNSSAERIYGYAASEIIGRPAQMLVAPDRPQEMMEILKRVCHGERIEHFETERRHKDGRTLRISLTASPIYDESGRLIGAAKIVRDLTEDRKRTEAQLKSKPEQLAEFSHALGLAPAMVRTLDDKVMFWGDGLEKLYGWLAKEAIGQASRELLATEFPQPPPQILNELSKTGWWQGELQQTH